MHVLRFLKEPFSLATVDPVAVEKVSALRSSYIKYSLDKRHLVINRPRSCVTTVEVESGFELDDRTKSSASISKTRLLF